MHERWDEVLIQRFVDGREVNVGIVGDQVLPIAEINFGDMPRGMWKIVSYRSKWITGSDEDLGAAPSCPADLPRALTRELEKIALPHGAQSAVRDTDARISASTARGVRGCSR